MQSEQASDHTHTLELLTTAAWAPGLLMNTFAFMGSREVKEVGNIFGLPQCLVQLLPQQPQAGNPLEINLFVHDYERCWPFDVFIKSLSDQRSAQPSKEFAAASATALKAAGAGKLSSRERSAPAQLCLLPSGRPSVQPATEPLSTACCLDSFFKQFAYSRCGHVVALHVLVSEWGCCQYTRAVTLNQVLC